MKSVSYLIIEDEWFNLCLYILLHHFPFDMHDKWNAPDLKLHFINLQCISCLGWAMFE